MKQDVLGDKLKDYEKFAEGKLFRNLPIIARIDGKAFHTFTKGFARPYDATLSEAMRSTTKKLVEDTNAVLGYTQSDEISLLFYNDSEDSEIFFNAKHSKMVSVLSSMTTAFFNQRFKHQKEDVLAFFDCRVFNLQKGYEIYHYFKWRETDATKNSISMAARAFYSHKEVDGKNSSEKQEMIFQKGQNWNNYPSFFKRGSYYKRFTVNKQFTNEEVDKLPKNHEARKNPNLSYTRNEVSEWLIRAINTYPTSFWLQKLFEKEGA